jgi:hypothetical protein
VLILLDLDGDGCDIVVKFTVVHDLVGQTLVIHVSHSLLQELEVPTGTSEQVPEPRQECLERGVDTVVGHRIQVNDVGLFVGPLRHVVA